MLAKLEEIIKSVNSTCHVEYDEVHIANIKADELPYGQTFAYIEEFRHGEYGTTGYRKHKTTRVELWFCHFCPMHGSAREREALRAEIENTLILPFIAAYGKETRLLQPETWKWYAPPPRFDANEVAIMLQFDYKTLSC